MESEDALLLMTLTGIDYYTAMLVACEIGENQRFPSAKQFVSWIGLCPSLHQSGNSTHLGRMKKDSNERVSWILGQVARVASRTDPQMRELYQRGTSRQGDGKAVIRGEQDGHHHMAHAD